MTFNKLAKLITEREGKKSQVNIAQVSEILKVLRDDVNPNDLMKAFGFHVKGTYKIKFQVEKKK